MGAVHNFKGSTGIQKGATFARRFLWLDEASAPKSLAGYAVKFSLAASKEAQMTVLFVEGDGITVTDSAGQIDLLISSTQTAKLAFGTYYYMVVLDGGAGSTIRLLEGSIEVS